MTSLRGVAALGFIVILVLAFALDSANAEIVPSIRNATKDQFLDLVDELRHVPDTRDHEQVKRRPPFEPEAFEPKGSSAGDKKTMTPARFLGMVAKIREVGNLNHYERVIPLLPFAVEKRIDLIGHRGFVLAPVDSEWPSWLLELYYPIARPARFDPVDFWWLTFTLKQENLCVTRADIRKTFGPEDKEFYNGAVEERERIADEGKTPYFFVMTYSWSNAAYLIFHFLSLQGGPCLSEVTIGDPGPHDAHDSDMAYLKRSMGPPARVEVLSGESGVTPSDPVAPENDAEMMTPAQFLELVAKIRRVGDFRRYDLVIPLLPFRVVKETDGSVYNLGTLFRARYEEKPRWLSGL